MIEGEFTTTLMGLSGTVQGTVKYVLSGPMAYLYVPAMSGTSIDTNLYLTNLPDELKPIALQIYSACPHGEAFWDNSAPVDGPLSIEVIKSLGRIHFRKSTDWTASGTKGLIEDINLFYLLY